MNDPLLSLILPIYNEEVNLEANLSYLLNVILKTYIDYEIILCDDNSDDSTQYIINSLFSNNPKIIYLRFNQRIGKGGTIKNALKISKGKIIVILDMDIPITFNDFSNIVNHIKFKSNLVIAVRNTRPNTSTVRRFLSLCYNNLTQLFFKTGISDHQCGFKALSSDFATEIISNVRCDNFFFDTEMIVLAKRMKIPIEQLPVDWIERRTRGTSTIVPLRAILTFLIDILVLTLFHIHGRNLFNFKKSVLGYYSLNQSILYPIETINFNTNSRVINLGRWIYSKIAYG